MKKIRPLLLYIFITHIFCCCKNSNDFKVPNVNYQKEEIVINKNKSESFQEFKSKFFNDSIFQIKRIHFPLRGNSTEYIFDETKLKDTITDEYLIKNSKFYWNKKRWIFLNNINLSKREYLVDEQVNENKVQLKIKSKQDDFTIYFEFEKNKNQWFLVYYSSEWN